MERNLVAPVVSALLLSSVLLTACENGGPSAPSRAPSPASSSTPTPAPSPVPDVSKLVGVWNITVRVTEVVGSGCVAETMRSQIGAPNGYTLSVTRGSSSSVAVTLRSTSGDRACTFTPRVDSDGFTTYGQAGFYTCEQWFLDFRCSDGTLHSIFTIGEDISGRVSGQEISGSWVAAWFDGWDDYVGVGMKATFTGRLR